jgi:hypothetical protein
MSPARRWAGSGFATSLVAMALLGAPLPAAGAWDDPGFENLTQESLHTGSRSAGWEARAVGRDEIEDLLRAEVVNDAALARTGSRCVRLSIPAHTKGFEWISLGQRLYPDAATEYEVSVWARWIDGPDKAPEGANSTTRAESAILSFWARQRDGKGEFAGLDHWLFDNQWQKLTFRFRPTGRPEEFAWIYASLLPNQTPADTRVLLDDFSVSPCDDPPGVGTPTAGVAADADFSGQTGGALSPPWNFRPAPADGKAVTCEVVAGADPFVRLALAPRTSSYESGQLYQMLNLREGMRYRVSCRIRWDSFTPENTQPVIVNFGMFHGGSQVWYGPVDQLLKPGSDWVTYTYDHIPPYPGPWKLYVQLNGWGNGGRAVSVSVDDFTCVPVKE